MLVKRIKIENKETNTQRLFYKLNFENVRNSVKRLLKSVRPSVRLKVVTSTETMNVVF